MPLYTIPHHVNSFVTEWILIYLYNFLFSVFLFTDFFYKNIAAAVLYYYTTFSIAKLLAAKRPCFIVFHQVEKIQEDNLDLIPSPSVNIQIVS